MSTSIRNQLAEIFDGVPVALSTAGQGFTLTTTVWGNHYARPLDGPAMRHWLIRRARKREIPLPSSAQLRDAFRGIQAECHDGSPPNHHVHLRTGWNPHYRTLLPETNIYGAVVGYIPSGDQPGPAMILSLDTPAGRHAAVTSTGWSIAPSPTTFLHDPSQQALPDPEPAPDPDPPLAAFRKLLRLGAPASERHWQNLLHWMLAALRPAQNPAFHRYPILNLVGPPNSGKSLTAKLLVHLLDPSATPLHSLPSTERRLHQLASTRHVLAFDDPGSINLQKSRNLSRLAAGITSLHPALQGVLCRPIILTTGDPNQTRHLAPQIADVELLPVEEPLPPHQIATRFEALRPQILGALLTLLARNFENPDPIPHLRTTKTPDIGRSVTAMLKQEPAWTGTTSELAARLHLPVSPKALHQALKRMPDIVLESTHTRKGTRLRIMSREKSPLRMDSAAPAAPAPLDTGRAIVEQSQKSFGAGLSFARGQVAEREAGRQYMKKSLFAAAALFLVITLHGQAPVGSISGVVTDSSGGVVKSARVTVTDQQRATQRDLQTNAVGAFSAPSLFAGSYQVKVEVPGFRTAVRDATVEIGKTTTVDITLEVGATRDIVSIEAATAQIEYDSHTIDGVVTRQQIDDLPLNGRSFLQLAFLEPGIAASATPLGQYNRQFDVSVLGGNVDTTRITIDGEVVSDPVNGGTAQNLSQEVVQEFQISSVNFDLSTGICAGGAINIVTRGGTNTFHGTGFFYFRDHNMAAYPALRRDPLNPDPFFARRQSGFTVGGPIKKDKLFFFTSYEHTNQHGVFSANPAEPAFKSFAVVYGAPYYANEFDTRMDYRITDKHTAFLRYSHDGNNSLGQHLDNTLPSNWTQNDNYSDSGTFSVISAFTSHLVNEFRFGETYWKNNNTPPSAAACPGCLGLGGPQVMVIGSGLQFGNTTNSPQSRSIRRYIFSDNTTWQHGSHRIKFGGEWEYQWGVGTYAYLEPGYLVLYSPTQVAGYNSLVPPSLQIPLKSSYTSLADVLSLPLYQLITAVGETGQPPLFQRGNADHNNRTHLYIQDTWKLSPRLTVNFGLAHSYESNLINYDLTKPAFLAPIFGQAGLAAPSHQTKNFSPAAGFTWSPFKNNKTVVRGGFGIFYDTIDITDRLIERGYLGPLGTGRPIVTGSVFPNPIGSGTIQFTTGPTRFTGALAEQLLPQLRAGLAQQLMINPNNTDLTIRNINIFKTTNGVNGDLIANNFRVPYSEHISIGAQHQISNDFVVSADFVYRHFLHNELTGIDRERFQSLHPVLPVCSAAQATNPFAQCANGNITALMSEGHGIYKGLLVKADKRFAKRYQLLLSYALQSNQQLTDTQYDGGATSGGIYDLNNFNASYGPASPRHILNISGTVHLPYGLQASFISSFQSRLPFQPFIPGVDLTGSGINGFALPGSGYYQFNMGLGKSDLVNLVNQYNTAYAGKNGPITGQVFPKITLPASYDFGRNFNSQDLRISRSFPLFTEKVNLKVFGEVFNLLNYANLNSYSNNLAGSGFGQPAERTRQIFGTGGPRAFQFGARLNW